MNHSVMVRLHETPVLCPAELKPLSMVMLVPCMAVFTGWPSSSSMQVTLALCCVCACCTWLASQPFVCACPCMVSYSAPSCPNSCGICMPELCVVPKCYPMQPPCTPPRCTPCASSAAASAAPRLPPPRRPRPEGGEAAQRPPADPPGQQLSASRVQAHAPRPPWLIDPKS